MCEDDVRQAIRAGQTLTISDKTIVTPAARDLGEAQRSLPSRGDDWTARLGRLLLADAAGLTDLTRSEARAKVPTARPSFPAGRADEVPDFVRPRAPRVGRSRQRGGGRRGDQLPNTCQRPKCRYIFGLGRFRVVQPPAGPAPEARAWRPPQVWPGSCGYFRGAPDAEVVQGIDVDRRGSGACGDRLWVGRQREPPDHDPRPSGGAGAAAGGHPGAGPCSGPHRRVAETLSCRAARARGRAHRSRPRGVRSRHRRAADGAGRRANRTAPARAVRSAGRSHQRA